MDGYGIICDRIFSGCTSNLATGFRIAIRLDNANLWFSGIIRASFCALWFSMDVFRCVSSRHGFVLVGEHEIPHVYAWAWCTIGCMGGPGDVMQGSKRAAHEYATRISSRLALNLLFRHAIGC